jgi:hypothetical protein
VHCRHPMLTTTERSCGARHGSISIHRRVDSLP